MFLRVKRRKIGGLLLLRGYPEGWAERRELFITAAFYTAVILITSVIGITEVMGVLESADNSM